MLAYLIDGDNPLIRINRGLDYTVYIVELSVVFEVLKNLEYCAFFNMTSKIFIRGPPLICFKKQIKGGK